MVRALLLALSFAWPPVILSDAEAPLIYHCNTPCFKDVWSELPMDCSVVAYNLTIVLTLAEDAGLDSAERYCSMLHPVTLHVRTELQAWIDTWKRDVRGLYHCPTKEIEVTQDFNSLAHETLHVYEVLGLGISCDNDHKGWPVNVPYQELILGYQSICVSLFPLSECSE